jgi:hypothetical protein
MVVVLVGGGGWLCVVVFLLFHIAEGRACLVNAHATQQKKFIDRRQAALLGVSFRRTTQTFQNLRQAVQHCSLPLVCPDSCLPVTDLERLRQAVQHCYVS